MIIKTYAEKQKDDLKTRVAIAYYTAKFQRAKRLPNLQKILDNLDKKSRPKGAMTPEQMLETVKQLNAAFGGEVK